MSSTESVLLIRNIPLATDTRSTKRKTRRTLRSSLAYEISLCSPSEDEDDLSFRNRSRVRPAKLCFDSSDEDSGNDEGASESDRDFKRSVSKRTRSKLDLTNHSFSKSVNESSVLLKAVKSEKSEAMKQQDVLSMLPISKRLMEGVAEKEISPILPRRRSGRRRTARDLNYTFNGGNITLTGKEDPNRLIDTFIEMFDNVDMNITADELMDNASTLHYPPEKQELLRLFQDAPQNSITALVRDLTILHTDGINARLPGETKGRKLIPLPSVFKGEDPIEALKREKATEASEIRDLEPTTAAETKSIQAALRGLIKSEAIPVRELVNEIKKCAGKNIMPQHNRPTRANSVKNAVPSVSGGARTRKFFLYHKLLLKLKLKLTCAKP